MLLRSANLLFLGVALPLMIASPPAEAGHSDDVMKVVDEICLDHRASLNEVARKVAKLPFKPDPVARDRGPPPGGATWLPKLGTGSTLIFFAKTASTPLVNCRLVSHVADLGDLLGRLKAKFDLGEPKTSESSVQLTAKGEKTISGKLHAVELIYGFEENKPSGAFTLTINR
jgi:hypothetical protein